MKACENHEMSVVVFSEDTCPLCNTEKALKTIWVEIEKSMGILEELKRVANEAGLKKNTQGRVLSEGLRLNHSPLLPPKVPMGGGIWLINLEWDSESIN